MTSLRTLVFALALAPLSLAACGDDAEPQVDCNAKAVPKYSEMQSVWAKCTLCHSSTLTDPAARMAAPTQYNYDTYEAAKAAADIAVDEVQEGAMPRPPADKLTDDEKDQLYRWAACGTPN